MMENKKILIPLETDEGTNSKIALHFGHCPFFGIFDGEKLSVIKNNLDHHDQNFSPVDQIAEKINPAKVFVNQIGNRAISLFNEKGIKLITGDYKTAGEVIENLENISEGFESCGH